MRRRGIFAGLHFWAVILFFLVLTLEMGFLVSGTPSILARSGDWPVYLYTFLPYPMGVGFIGAPHGAIVLAAVGVIVLGYAWSLIRKGSGLVHALASGRRGLWSLGDVEAVGMALMAVLAVNFIWYLLLDVLGYAPHIPAEIQEASPIHLVEMLFFASVWEEIVIKLSFISLPLLVLHILFRSRFEWWRYILGGGIQMRPITLLLMLFSAGVFGYAHVSGWDASKFFPTFIGGLFTAFLFVRYGLHASILLHFANNFLAAPQILGNSPALGAGISLIILFFSGMGMLYWFMLFRSLYPSIRRSFTSREDEDSRSGRGPPPPRPPPPRSAYLCGSCGTNEFRFASGRFTCLRCGASITPPEQHEAAPPLKDVMEI